MGAPPLCLNLSNHVGRKQAANRMAVSGRNVIIFRRRAFATILGHWRAVAVATGLHWLGQDGGKGQESWKPAFLSGRFFSRQSLIHGAPGAGFGRASFALGLLGECGVGRAFPRNFRGPALLRPYLWQFGGLTTLGRSIRATNGLRRRMRVSILF